MNSKNDSKLTVINNHTYNQNKRKLSKQLEQEQNHRNGDHLEGYQQVSGREEVGRMEWSEGGGKWDNCNSIINKYI